MRKKLIILLLFLFAFPVYIDAKTSATISCTSSNVIANQSFTCEVNITPETPITTFKTNISFSSDFTLKKIEPASGWASNSTSLIDLSNPNYTDGQGLTVSTNIAKLFFEVNKNVNYGNKQIKISGFDLETEASANVNIQSNNSYLNDLSVSGMDFSFNYKTTTYNLTTTKESVSINATLMDTNSKFKEGYGSRAVNLKYGKNTVEVIVVAQNGSTTTYTLNIERLDQRGTNNNLSSLTVSDGTLKPSFNKNVLTYNVEVPDGTKQITIDAKKESSTASYEPSYGPRTIELVKGLNTVAIKVVSETGVSKTYTLNITTAEKSSNNFLKSVKLTGADINFDKNVYEYNVNVLYPTLEMNIIAVPEDIKAKVEVIGNKGLKIGENFYTINVIAENGSVLSYKFVVNRLEEGKELSNNNYLSELVINNYPIEFNKDVLDYNIKIKNEKMLTLSYNPEDTSAIVNVIGNNDLKNKSQIKIVVTSEDKNKRIYTINITKDEASSGLLYYIILGIVLVVAIVALIVIRKKRGPKQTQIISQEIDIPGSKLVLESKKPEDVNVTNAQVGVNNKNNK